LRPIAAADAASGATSTTELPPRASAWHWSSAAGITRKPFQMGASTTTRLDPAARSAFAAERMPPSIHRRPLSVTGGQTPGTAQLALTASIRLTPLELSNVADSPVSASTAVMSRRWVGHSWLGSQAPITARRCASASGGEARASRPSRLRARAGDPGVNTARP